MDDLTDPGGSRTHVSKYNAIAAGVVTAGVFLIWIGFAMAHPASTAHARGAWHLIAPPKVEVDGASTWDFNAPLSKWTVIRSFNSSVDCTMWKTNAEYRADQVRRTVDVDRCVSSSQRRARK